MSSDNEDDLIGFKDFLDAEGDKAPKNNKRRRDSNNSGFELLTFLENESSRLDKQNKFYEEKIYMLKNFPQSEPIKNNVSQEIEVNLSILEKMLLKKDSSFFKSMNEILKQFKK